MFPAFFNLRWVRLICDTSRRTSADLILCRDMPLAPTAVYVARRLGLPVVLDVAESYRAMIGELGPTGTGARPTGWYATCSRCLGGTLGRSKGITFSWSQRIHAR